MGASKDERVMKLQVIQAGKFELTNKYIHIYLSETIHKHFSREYTICRSYSALHNNDLQHCKQK